jgi:hypothetical protein
MLGFCFFKIKKIEPYKIEPQRHEGTKGHEGNLCDAWCSLCLCGLKNCQNEDWGGLFGLG